MNALLVTLMLCIAPLFSDGNPVSLDRQRCEGIQIDLCKSLPYNSTRLPNSFEQDTQSSVNRTLWDLAQRINGVVCSEDLLFFVCSLYLPICVENQGIRKSIKPCRSVCEKVKNDCQAAVKSIAGVESPFLAFPEFECEKLEDYDKGVCLTPKAFIQPTSPDPKASLNAERYIKKGDFVKANFDFAVKGIITSMNKTSSGYAIRFNVSRVIIKNGRSFRSNVAQIWSPRKRPAIRGAIQRSRILKGNVERTGCDRVNETFEVLN
ncbi:hypothetical protein ACROYT_G017130 [Oculina patagonica]